MLREIFNFIISIFTMFFNSLRSFELDSGISLFSLFLFLIFTRVVIFLINYIKHITDVSNGDDKK